MKVVTRTPFASRGLSRGRTLGTSQYEPIPWARANRDCCDAKLGSFEKQLSYSRLSLRERNPKRCFRGAKGDTNFSNDPSAVQLGLPTKDHL